MLPTSHIINLIEAFQRRRRELQQLAHIDIICGRLLCRVAGIEVKNIGSSPTVVKPEGDARFTDAELAWFRSPLTAGAIS